ncbi:unnamed protein product [Prorocentrum cordatum]|uniref:Uncharacterized protein n=1 Tax=Prorocentrum cordatum TaxID=2364126 RepID=A0ABN9XXL0_9DINO|nr:unnamed protein product [Polarella glacialis]
MFAIIPGHQMRIAMVQMSLYSLVTGHPVVQTRSSCRTSVVGEDCYKKVVWAMQTGVAKHPEYFSPLTNHGRRKASRVFFSIDQYIQLRGFPAAPAQKGRVL